jgi:polyisoprenyl-teichoic acid--peptidoglycan teichoic acid transferase
LRAVVRGIIPFVAASIVVTGCAQSVFVGMPTPIPEQTIISPTGEIPEPPFGPRAYARLYEAPGEAPPQLVSDDRPPAEPAFAWSETKNILVLGTDRRPWDASWRTDTIMVVGVDRARQRIAVLSIPRDLYVEIPHYGYGRINQADYIGERVARIKGGGPALISMILNETFGIETEHWVRFEMTGFQSIVDAAGGVTVHLDCPFYEPIFNLDTDSWDYFTLPPGDVHMDGETAYWYVRLRLRESDIGRSNRQRQVLWAFRNQVLSNDLLLRFPELWSAFRHAFATDLSFLEMLDLVRFGIALDPQNVRSTGISLKELQSHTTENGASVLIITDTEKVQQVVDGVWDAPAMINANRKDDSRCEPIPTGPPNVPASIVAPANAQPTPAAAAGEGEGVGAVDGASTEGS